MKKIDLTERPNWILMSFVLDSFVYHNNRVSLDDVTNFVWKCCSSHKCETLYNFDSIVSCLFRLEDCNYLSISLDDISAAVIYSRKDLAGLKKK